MAKKNRQIAIITHLNNLIEETQASIEKHKKEISFNFQDTTFLASQSQTDKTGRNATLNRLVEKYNFLLAEKARLLQPKEVTELKKKIENLIQFQQLFAGTPLPQDEQLKTLQPDQKSDFDAYISSLQTELNQKEAQVLDALPLYRQQTIKTILTLQSTIGELLAQITELKNETTTIRQLYVNAQEIADAVDQKEAAQNILLNEEISKLQITIATLEKQLAHQIASTEHFKDINQDLAFEVVETHAQMTGHAAEFTAAENQLHSQLRQMTATAQQQLLDAHDFYKECLASLEIESKTIIQEKDQIQEQLETTILGNQATIHALQKEIASLTLKLQQLSDDYEEHLKLAAERDETTEQPMSKLVLSLGQKKLELYDIENNTKQENSELKNAIAVLAKEKNATLAAHAQEVILNEELLNSLQEKQDNICVLLEEITALENEIEVLDEKADELIFDNQQLTDDNIQSSNEIAQLRTELQAATEAKINAEHVTQETEITLAITLQSNETLHKQLQIADIENNELQTSLHAEKEKNAKLLAALIAQQQISADLRRDLQAAQLGKPTPSDAVTNNGIQDSVLMVNRTIESSINTIKPGSAKTLSFTGAFRHNSSNEQLPSVSYNFEAKQFN